MKVVILGKMPSIGKVGDVREVADGYARNFLIPKKLAAPATNDRLHSIKISSEEKERQIAKAAKNLRRLQRSLNGYVCKVTGKANPQGTLFAAVTPLQLSVILKAEG